jgi:hypothetical protein
MRWMFLFAAALCVACSSSTVPAPTGVPSRIVLTVTMVSGPPPVTASVVATLEDAGRQPVPSVPLFFSTTAGFITSGGLTNGSGQVQAFLTAPPGTTATVTASETAVTPAVSATTVVQF